MRKQIASSTIIPRHVAEELGKVAGCHWRTIQAAAAGRRTVGEGGAKAQTIVADHFDLNPAQRPSGYVRPAHAPLPLVVASRIATETDSTTEAVQRIAGGIPDYSAAGMRITAAVHAHYEQHPEDRPTSRVQASEVQP